MLRTMINAAVSMNEVQKQLDIISNNIANSETTGYRAKNTRFSELIRQQFNQVDEKNEQVANSRLTPAGLRLGTGTMVNASINSLQGSIKETGRDLDVAFGAPSQYLQVNAGGNIRYTREGSLYLQPGNNPNQVQLVTSEGHPILDENGNEIVLNANFRDISIDKNGRLTAISRGNQPNQQVNLGVVQVNNSSALISEGENLFSVDGNYQGALTALNGANRQAIQLQQGALETSNVDMSKELTDLMTTQRSYQMNSRTITMGDQMLGLINTIR
ncbi:flagellar hook-basal body protein [Bacillus altitudinis]|uniref:flagellar hook-basal body protein n=1 Tax=Bacillus altitudinis TaxID=293387 RepID=UPI0010FF8DFC|nr:flagellar hook-basal body protein [Bacillus altitudinis]QCU20629.1 flagellar hook-basal body protein [Bacillus altitudinis]